MSAFLLGGTYTVHVVWLPTFQEDGCLANVGEQPCDQSM